jgi:hypothetical protein
MKHMAKVGVGFAIFGDGTEEEKVCFRSKVWCAIPENEVRNGKIWILSPNVVVWSI